MKKHHLYGNNFIMSKTSLLNIVDVDIEKWKYLLNHVPKLDYNNISLETRDYRNPNNVVGHQQRAFIIYHALKEFQRTYEIGLEVGCGQAISPFCIGTDYYAGDNHPEYGGTYKPHVRCVGEKLPFKDNSFSFICSHHSLEHMKDTYNTLKEWLRVLKPNSKMFIVMPDKTFGPFGDKSHINEMTADEFKQILTRLENENIIKIIEHDTFNNNFSYNTIVEKRN